MSGQRRALDVGTRALMAMSGSTLTFPRRSPLKMIKTSPVSVPSRTFSSSPVYHTAERSCQVQTRYPPVIAATV